VFESHYIPLLNILHINLLELSSGSDAENPTSIHTGPLRFDLRFPKQRVLAPSLSLDVSTLARS
jgi:hypothetical protein